MQVLDEPLYAHYLKLTGAPRPYRQLVLDSMDNDGVPPPRSAIGREPR